MKLSWTSLHHLYLILGVLAVSVASKRQGTSKDVIWYPVDDEDGVFISIYGEKYGPKWHGDIRGSRSTNEDYGDRNAFYIRQTSLPTRSKRQTSFGLFPWNFQLPQNQFFNFLTNEPESAIFNGDQPRGATNEIRDYDRYKVNGPPVTPDPNVWALGSSKPFFVGTAQKRPKVPFWTDNAPALIPINTVDRPNFQLQNHGLNSQHFNSNSQFQGLNTQFQNPNSQSLNSRPQLQRPNFQGSNNQFHNPKPQFSSFEQSFQNSHFPGANVHSQGFNSQFQDNAATFQSFPPQFQGSNAQFASPGRPSGRPNGLQSNKPFDNPVEPLVFPEDSEPTRRPTTTSTPRPVTSVPEVTEPTPMTQCERLCPVTPEFNPVCGSDSMTYSNPGRLKCAQNCGKSVRLVHYGTCRSSRLITPPVLARPKTPPRFFNF